MADENKCVSCYEILYDVVVLIKLGSLRLKKTVKDTS